MKMPKKGDTVFIEGYGSPMFIGAHFEDGNGQVGLKYPSQETEAYGSGILWIPFEEFRENRVYPEQVPNGEEIVESSQKARELFEERD